MTCCGGSCPSIWQLLFCSGLGQAQVRQFCRGGHTDRVSGKTCRTCAFCFRVNSGNKLETAILQWFINVCAQNAPHGTAGNNDCCYRSVVAHAVKNGQWPGNGLELSDVDDNNTILQHFRGESENRGPEAIWHTVHTVSEKSKNGPKFKLCVSSPRTCGQQAHKNNGNNNSCCHWFRGAPPNT